MATRTDVRSRSRNGKQSQQRSWGGTAQLPSNVEAEQAVLGSILIDLDGSTLHKVIPILGRTGDKFHLSKHKMIYQAMISLYQRGIAPDNLTVSTELRENGKLKFVGGDAYIAELVTATPTHVHATHYAKLVHEAWLQRRALQASVDIARMVYSSDSVADTLQSSVYEAIRAAFSDTGLDCAIPGDTLIDMISEDLDRNERERGVITGIAPLDDKLKPMDGGSLFILAPTSTGKTSLLLQMIRTNAINGYRPVLYFNELDIRRLMRRLLVMESIDWSEHPFMPAFTVYDIRYRKRQYAEQIKRVADRMSSWVSRCTFVPAHGWTAQQIVDHFTNLWLQGVADMVAVDYLDLIPYDRRGNMSEEIGDKLAILRQGAERCRLRDSDPGLPIIITGQPTKGFKGSTRPTVEDAFGSVRVSQFTYKALVLWREPDDDGNPGDITWVFIDKNADDGNVGHKVPLMVAGTDDRVGFMFYPVELDREPLDEWGDDPF